MQICLNCELHSRCTLDELILSFASHCCLTSTRTKRITQFKHTFRFEGRESFLPVSENVESYSPMQHCPRLDTHWLTCTPGVFSPHRPKLLPRVPAGWKHPEPCLSPWAYKHFHPAHHHRRLITDDEISPVTFASLECHLKKSNTDAGSPKIQEHECCTVSPPKGEY